MTDDLIERMMEAGAEAAQAEFECGVKTTPDTWRRTARACLAAALRNLADYLEDRDDPLQQLDWVSRAGLADLADRLEKADG